MTAENKMQFPFTNQKEILHWEALYIKAQKEERQRQEEDVRKIKCSVEDKGYLTKCELMEMARWKDRFARSNIKKGNSPERIEAVTRDAFRPGDDWEKLKKLMALKGVGQSRASAILHLYDQERYPIFDPHALCSIRIKKEEVEGDKKFWKEYVKYCQAKAECHDVCMRTLDRALYKFSKSGAATALKTITDEMFFLELERRGYDLSKPLRPEVSEEPSENAEIVKIS